MTTPCSLELLESALSGNLPPDREETLHRHLDECESCAAALTKLSGGEVWRQEVVSMLATDEYDEALEDSRVGRDEWSSVDFTVDHLEPAEEPNVLGRLGGYDVLEIVGRGGMGVVLKAFDPELKRCVAIKVLSPHLAQSSLARKRFTREAQAAAAVVHPNVMAIHQVQPGGRLPFLVMPLVAGESLAQRLAAQGRLELTETMRIGMQAAAALAAAHEQGLVHRDVKPANILLEKGVERALLTDFGLARAADDVSMTRWGVIAGTPQYMSPEQANGEPLDGRSDLFSLGCVLYEMATGISPFRADSTMATLRRLIDDAPPAMAALNPELPPWFIGLVERLLEKEPSRRFASAKEVSELLEGCLAHLQQPASAPLPAALSSLPLGDGQGVGAVDRSFESCRPEQACAVPAQTAQIGIMSRLCRNCASLFRPTKPRKRSITGAIVMLSLLGISLLAVGYVGTTPPNISGQWQGENWGQVTLTQTAPGQYTGTYTETNLVGRGPGKIELNWSRIERRFKGTWSEGDERFGTLSIHLVNGAIQGAYHTDLKSKPNAPELAELHWTLASHAKGSGSAATIGGQSPMTEAGQITAEGWRLRQQGRLAEAESRFKRAVELDPQDANAWNGLGWSQFNAGKAEAAIESFRKAIQLEPDHPAALNGLGQVLLQQRRYAEAEKVLLKAAPRAPAAWFGLARLYLLQGEFEKAEPWAKKLVDAPAGDDVDKPLLKEMLDAAKTKHLSDRLRARLAPHRADTMPGAVSTPAAVYSADAERFVDLLIQGEFDKAAGCLDHTAKAIFTPTALRQFWTGYATASGKFTGRGQARPEHAFGFDIVFVPVSWERNKMDLQLVFDQQGLIGSLFMVAPGTSVARDIPSAVKQAPKLSSIHEPAGEIHLRHVGAVVKQAVNMISTCQEGDPRIEGVMRSLKGLDQAAAVRELATFLDSQTDTIRRAAIYVLWKGEFTSIEPAVSGLLKLCEHKEDLTRGMAALALGGNHVARSLPVLEKMTTDDKSGYARRCAAYALGTLGDPSAIGVLEKALKDPEALVRENAKAALKMLQTRKAAKDRQTPPPAKPSRDQIIVEDLALQMIVAIREKDDKKLKSLASDRIKGWREALPAFAVELREKYRWNMGDEKFDLRPTAALVEGDLAAVRCTGPKELKGKCLVLFFIKSDGCWLNYTMRAAMENVPLSDWLAKIKKQP